MFDRQLHLYQYDKSAGAFEACEVSADFGQEQSIPCGSDKSEKSRV